MRLTCPNCSARYEVDDSLVPPEGRDVQCSNCATTWFQPGNRARVEEPDGASASSAAPHRRDLDPALRNILREEREREEQLRRAAAPVEEEQEEMALDSPAPAPTHMTEDDTPEAEDDEDVAAIREMVAEETARPGRAHGGRDLFPDIEEINSTLRATTDRNSGDRDTSDIDSMDLRPRRRRGFRLGFVLMILLAAAGIGAYAFPSEIVDLLPQAEPYLTLFVDQVDQLRFQLDDLVQSLAGQLASTTDN